MQTITLSREELLKIACNEYGLTPSALRLLILILVTMTEDHTITYSQNETARMLDVSLGAASVSFHRLVAKGILSKIPKSHLFTLSPEFASRITCS